MAMKLHISRGNNKIGNVPNLSLPPHTTCVPLEDRPCHADCYAQKFYHMRKTVRNAWDENLAFWQTDPQGFEQTVAFWLRQNPSRLFRWHVGGDIPDPAYFCMMLNIADAFPSTIFLAYTRRKYVSVLPNMLTVRSHWLDDFDWTDRQPHVYVRRSRTDEVPGPLGLVCPDSCVDCEYQCWFMRPGDTILFEFRKQGGRHAKA